jgi:hypothetical protein
MMATDSDLMTESMARLGTAMVELATLIEHFAEVYDRIGPAFEAFQREFNSIKENLDMSRLRGLPPERALEAVRQAARQVGALSRVLEQVPELMTLSGNMAVLLNDKAATARTVNNLRDVGKKLIANAQPV